MLAEISGSLHLEEKKHLSDMTSHILWAGLLRKQKYSGFIRVR